MMTFVLMEVIGWIRISTAALHHMIYFVSHPDKFITLLNEWTNIQ